MTRFSRVVAPLLLSAAIFGATLAPGAAAAATGGNHDGNMQPIQDPRAHQALLRL